LKRDADFFDGAEPVLLYIAKTLKDALRLENALTEAGIDFGVEADDYRGGLIFSTVRTGAFFYARPETADAAKAVVVNAGFKPFVGPE